MSHVTFQQCIANEWVVSYMNESCHMNINESHLMNTNESRHMNVNESRHINMNVTHINMNESRHMNMNQSRHMNVNESRHMNVNESRHISAVGRQLDFGHIFYVRNMAHFRCILEMKAREVKNRCFSNKKKIQHSPITYFYFIWYVFW